MIMSDFKDILNNKVNEAYDLIKEFLPKEEGLQKRVAESMNYSFNSGGKRLRPMFMMESYRLFKGEDLSKIAPFMAAIEMIHTYSLIHDDLPAMDNDDYRRGRLTNHKMFDEATAILAGDGLLNYAFETLSLAMKPLIREMQIRQSPRPMDAATGRSIRPPRQECSAENLR